MKKLLSLVLILAVASLASATTVSLVGPAPGELGSAENPAVESDLITIQVALGNGTLLGLDSILTVTGPGTIVDAFKVADAGTYGWDPGLTADPIMGGNSAEMGAGNFAGNSNASVGYFVIHCDGPGEVVLTLSEGQSFGGSMDTNWMVPTYGPSITIHQIPEPATIALLCLGGLLIRKKK